MPGKIDRYRKQISDYFFQNGLCLTSMDDVSFTDPILYTHLEYELFYLTHDLESAYMMDWISLSFSHDIPVPSPLGNHLSPMEKEHRLRLLWSAMTPIPSPSTTKSSSLFYMMIVFVAIFMVWYFYGRKWTSNVYWYIGILFLALV